VNAWQPPPDGIKLRGGEKKKKRRKKGKANHFFLKLGIGFYKDRKTERRSHWKQRPPVDIRKNRGSGARGGSGEKREGLILLFRSIEVEGGKKRRKEAISASAS